MHALRLVVPLQLKSRMFQPINA